eukprot:TRINITY_DN2759_c0_g2_i1.p1 TRINITY_DN2759_c0_g2~~TRINITY_DN2759_c0_g2_i1.p1  ORF type:complete len:461 (-),score=102.03 TRINITY_DN2759_c0_g2_i1:139-1521(-)
MVKLLDVFRRIGRLLVASFFYNFSLLMFEMTLPVYLDTICDNSADASFLFGVISAVNLLFQFLCLPALGCGADRFGRKKFVVVSVMGLAFWTGISSIVTRQSMVFLIVIGGAVQGAVGSFIASTNSMIADVSEPVERPKFFAVYQVLGNSLGMSGALVGAVLVDYGFSERFPIILSFIVALFVLAWVGIMVRESLEKKNRIPIDWKRANPIGTLRLFYSTTLLAGTLLCSCLVMFAAAAVNTLGWFYVKERYNATMTEYVISAMLFAMVGLIGSSISSPLSNRFGERNVLVASFFIGGISIIATAASPYLWLFYITGSITGLIVMSLPAINSLLSKNVVPQKMAEVQSGLRSFSNFSQMLGAFAFAYLFAVSIKSHPKMPYLAFFVAGIIILLAAIIALVYFNKYPHDYMRVCVESEGRLILNGDDDDEEDVKSSMLQGVLDPDDDEEASNPTTDVNTRE